MSVQSGALRVQLSVPPSSFCWWLSALTLPWSQFFLTKPGGSSGLFRPWPASGWRPSLIDGYFDLGVSSRAVLAFRSGTTARRPVAESGSTRGQWHFLTFGGDPNVYRRPSFDMP